MKNITLLLILSTCIKVANTQTLYFPPINNNLTWETTSPTSLGWCTQQIDSLYQVLQEENSKAFILLKDGKIVLEKYFDSFTKDSLWYWASAGKTLTSFLVGKAQEEKLLNIEDLTSKYLGKGWTSLTSDQEDKIKIRNQITMTTGLDDGVSDNHCLDKSCLIYKADAGTRWAYHNAPYTLLEKVIENASKVSINSYTQSRLKNQTGMTGAWVTVDQDNVFFSKPTSMARYGLLMQNYGIWNKDTLMKDMTYMDQMIKTSQNINLSYGYLWWLNGKPSFMLPGTQFVFPFTLVPSAPADLFSGIGKNGQLLCVSRSKGLVMVRMGNASNGDEVSILLLNKIWNILDKLICTTTNTNDNFAKEIILYPNPVNDELVVKGLSAKDFEIEISNTQGQILIAEKNQNIINLSSLAPAMYFVKIASGNKFIIQKIVKQQ